MVLIYVIENIINGKKYIGLDSDTTGRKNSRWLDHKSKYNKKLRYKTKLYPAMRKYGIDNFNYYILEDNIDDPVELVLKESAYIKLYDTITNGYNILPVDIAFLESCGNDKLKEVRSAAYREWWASLSEAEQELKISNLTQSRSSEDRSACMRDFWNNMSEKDRKSFTERRRRKTWVDVSNDERERKNKIVTKNARRATLSKLGEYEIFSPTNERITFYSINQFSLEYGVDSRKISDMLKGYRMEYKGWRNARVIRPPVSKATTRSSQDLRLLAPDGTVHQTDNIKQFCVDNNLNHMQIYRVKNGYDKTHKGWKVLAWKKHCDSDWKVL